MVGATDDFAEAVFCQIEIVTRRCLIGVPVIPIVHVLLVFVVIVAFFFAILVVLGIAIIVVIQMRKRAERKAAEREEEIRHEQEEMQNEIDKYKQELADAAMAAVNTKDEAITSEIRQFAKENPEITANLLRNWLKEGES